MSTINRALFWSSQHLNQMDVLNNVEPMLCKPLAASTIQPQYFPKEMPEYASAEIMRRVELDGTQLILQGKLSDETINDMKKVKEIWEQVMTWAKANPAHVDNGAKGFLAVAGFLFLSTAITAIELRSSIPRDTQELNGYITRLDKLEANQLTAMKNFLMELKTSNTFIPTVGGSDDLRKKLGTLKTNIESASMELFHIQRELETLRRKYLRQYDLAFKTAMASAGIAVGAGVALAALEVSATTQAILIAAAALGVSTAAFSFIISSKCSDMLEKIARVSGKVEEMADAVRTVYTAIVDRKEVPAY